MQVTSREYKFIVDRSMFSNLDAALADIRADAGDVARSLGLMCVGEFDLEDPKQRSIRFLDTTDFTLHLNGLLLRQRVNSKRDKTEYTLKCRSEDRYIASGANLSARAGLDASTKFEEDIGCPFVSRFSHSTTVDLEVPDEFTGDRSPGLLSEAASLFPGLLATRRDGLRCPSETPLAAVHGRVAFERVFTGPTIHFPHGLAGSKTTPATLAVIVWSKDKKGRVLTAECSFRYKDDQEAFVPDVAFAAKCFFERLQQMDWARPEASTKTQYMYGHM